MLSGPTWVFGLVFKTWLHCYSLLGGEGGLHGYPPPPMTERVGFMVTSRWGRWVLWLLPAGGEGGFYGYFLLGKSKKIKKKIGARNERKKKR